jgi:hypothetical protein
VRLVVVVLAIYPGAVIGGLVAYLVAWVIMPAERPGEPQSLSTPARAASGLVRLCQIRRLISASFCMVLNPDVTKTQATCASM